MNPAADSPGGPCFEGDESLFRQMFETSTDACFLLDRLPGEGYAYSELNPAGERFLQTALAQIRGIPLDRLLHPDLADYYLGRCRQCLEADAPITYDEEVELPAGRAWFSTTLIPLRDKTGRITRIAGVCRDVTLRRREEATRRETQKLESLGVLAGGIAHDFNNLLAIALGNLGIVQHQLPAEDPSQSMLATAEKALIRATDLTRQLLAYAGKGPVVVMTLDLASLVLGMKDLLAASLPKKVSLAQRMEPGLLLVEADSAQLQQVLLNLVVNGAESIGDAVGEVSIAVGREDLDAARLRALMPHQDLDPGPKVVLAVADTGCGIDPGILERIFDPFFSTKARGRGLGLSAIQGILRTHRAGITIESTPGQGSVFRVFFPASPEAEFLPALPVQAAKPAGAARRRILMADDEADLRALVQRLFERFGFSVDCVQDGQEAVDAFRRRPEAYDLVMLDVSMPRMGGGEAFALIRGIRPVPTLFCSGYTQDALPHEYLRAPGVGFLAKPFRNAELKEAIQRLLAAGGD